LHLHTDSVFGIGELAGTNEILLELRAGGNSCVKKSCWFSSRVFWKKGAFETISWTRIYSLMWLLRGI